MRATGFTEIAAKAGAAGMMARAGFIAALLLTLAPAACAPKPAIGGPFVLIDQNGARFTEADLKGKPSLVFFGFTYCPDFCPLALQKFRAALELLGEDGAAVRTVFVTVDPERDTPEVLAAYLSSSAFPDNVVGLTGSPEQVAAAAKAYRIYYAKVEAPKGYADYLMDHSTFIYVLDADGRFVRPLPHASSPQEIADGVRPLLTARGRN